MAGHAQYTALLDACVLYPAVVRDALLSLNDAGFFAAKWTRTIESEWTSNLLANRRDITAEQVASTCEAMHEAAADWEVVGYESLVDGLSLPDDGDRHVLAAAIRGHADCIVTSNVDDFPREYLATFDLELFHPDDFIVCQLDLDEVDALKAFKAMRKRLVRPAFSPQRFVALFERNHLARTAARLADSIELL